MQLGSHNEFKGLMIFRGNAKLKSVFRRARDGGLRFGKPFCRCQYKILASLRAVGNTYKLREQLEK